MRAIVKLPGEPAEIRDVPNELKPLQELVGGYIETVTLATDVVLSCNEDGRLMGLPPNAWGICGTLVIVGAQDAEFTDLTERDAHHLLGLLHEKAGCGA